MNVWLRALSKAMFLTNSILCFYITLKIFLFNELLLIEPNRIIITLEIFLSFFSVILALTETVEFLQKIKKEK